MFAYFYSQLRATGLIMAFMIGSNSLAMEPSFEDNPLAKSPGLLELPEELIQEILLSTATPDTIQEQSTNGATPYNDSPLYGDSLSCICRMYLTSKVVQKKITNKSTGKKLLAHVKGTLQPPSLYLAALMKSNDLISLSKELAETSRTPFMAEIKNTYSVSLVDPQLTRRSSTLAFLEQALPQPSKEGFGFILHQLLKSEPNIRPIDGPGIRYIMEKKPTLQATTMASAIEKHSSLELLSDLVEALYHNGYALNEQDKRDLLSKAVNWVKYSERELDLFYRLDRLIGDASGNLTDEMQYSYHELKRLPYSESNQYS